jgi:hypothetical protein
MREKTSKRLRACTSQEFLPGNTIRYASVNERKYWAKKGWIVRKGDFYVLTVEGWRAE